MSRPADSAARSSIRAKPAVVKGAPRSETNMNGDDGASRWRRRSSHFAAGQGMRAGRTILRPADVQGSLSEIDLIPTEVAQFGRTQTVPEGD